MVANMYLLDTNILMELVRNKERGRRINAEYNLAEHRNAVQPLTSRVVHGELWSLAAKNSWGEKKRKVVHEILHNLVTVDIHYPEVIQAYVDIDVFSQKYTDGARNMGKNDIWIAACAKAANATLLTTDQDFEHITGDLMSVEIVP